MLSLTRKKQKNQVTDFNPVLLEGRLLKTDIGPAFKLVDFLIGGGSFPYLADQVKDMQTSYQFIGESQDLKNYKWIHYLDSEEPRVHFIPNLLSLPGPVFLNGDLHKDEMISLRAIFLPDGRVFARDSRRDIRNSENEVEDLSVINSGRPDYLGLWQHTVRVASKILRDPKLEEFYKDYMK